jgi:hypothetical protein
MLGFARVISRFAFIIDDASRMILAGVEFKMLMTIVISSLDVVEAISIPRTLSSG